MSTENDNKKEVAKTLYMSGSMDMADIADKVGVSRQTISRWVSAESWKEQRAAKNITRPQLVNKLLQSIDALLDNVIRSDDPATIGGIADKLSKFAATIEKLDKKANIVDTVDVFIAFQKWLEFRSTVDKTITPEFMRTLNALQDSYINELACQR